MSTNTRELTNVNPEKMLSRVLCCETETGEHVQYEWQEIASVDNDIAERCARLAKLLYV